MPLLVQSDGAALAALTSFREIHIGFMPVPPREGVSAAAPFGVLWQGMKLSKSDTLTSLRRLRRGWEMYKLLTGKERGGRKRPRDGCSSCHCAQVAKR